MRQFVLPRDADPGKPLTVTGSDSKYILKVLRLGVGDSFPAIDRNGRHFLMEIIKTEANSFTASCVPDPGQHQLRKAEGNGGAGIILLQCLPKGKKLELIVRQAVEAGAGAIVPVESRNSVAVIREDRSGTKTARLEKIAEEAAQQSGNPGVPEIYPAVKMSDLPNFLNEAGYDGLKLFCHEKRLDHSSLHHRLHGNSGTVMILIGPEGGLSEKETEFLLASGFYPVYLGENVLRTETAAIYALGAVNTILLEKNEWKTDIRE